MGLELIKLWVWNINLGWGEVCPSLLGCFCHNPIFDLFILILFTENDKKKNDEKKYNNDDEKNKK